MIPTATVQFYDVVVFFHILGVVIGFGPTFVYALFAGMAAREGLHASLAVERAILRWNQTGNTAGMVVILLSGIYLVADRWEFGDFFVSWGLVVIIALFGLVHGYFLPRERRLIAGLEAEAAAAGADTSKERSPELAAIDREVARVGMVAGITIVLTVYVMTAKPFL
jgi:hypothetical protein